MTRERAGTDTCAILRISDAESSREARNREGGNRGNGSRESASPGCRRPRLPRYRSVPARHSIASLSGVRFFTFAANFIRSSSGIGMRPLSVR